MFAEQTIKMQRLSIMPIGLGVKIVTDAYGGTQILDGLPCNEKYYVEDAKWLPTQEIQVIMSNGEVRHFTSLYQYYYAGQA